MQLLPFFFFGNFVFTERFCTLFIGQFAEFYDQQKANHVEATQPPTPSECTQPTQHTQPPSTRAGLQAIL